METKFTDRWFKVVMAITFATSISACGSGDDGPQVSQSVPTAPVPSVVANVPTPIPTPIPTPAPAPPSVSPTSPNNFATKALSLVNDYRASARNCGSVTYAAAAPLLWDNKLEAAAITQSQYMQSIKTMTHSGAGNNTLADRVTQSGYKWSTIGENVAVGQGSIDQVMQDWINSPGHCANMMNASFKSIALALDAGMNNTSSDDYWTMDLAAP